MTARIKIGWLLAGFSLLVEVVNVYFRVIGTNQDTDWLSLWAPGICFVLLVLSIFVSERASVIIQAGVVVLVASAVAFFGGDAQQNVSGVFAVVAAGMIYQYKLVRITWFKLFLLAGSFVVMAIVGAFITGSPHRAASVILLAVFAGACLLWLFGDEIRRLTRENVKMSGMASMGHSSAQVTHLLKAKTSALQSIVDNGIDSEEMLELLKNAVEDIQNDVGMIMTYSRAAVCVDPVSTNVGRLMRSVALMVGHLPSVRGRVLIDVVSTSDVPLMVVPSSLKASLQNLMTNAVEAILGNGHVVARYDGTIITVEDTGSGIPVCSGCSKRTCTRCPRFSAGNSTKEHGNGLGMVQVQEMCQQHGFDLKISPRISGGTRIEIILVRG